MLSKRRVSLLCLTGGTCAVLPSAEEGALKHNLLSAFSDARTHLLAVLPRQHLRWIQWLLASLILHGRGINVIFS